MKFIIAIQNRMDGLKAQALGCLKRKEGQNTIEYILMLGVVVGIALAVGMGVKAFMPDLFEKIKAKLLGGVDSMQ